jgi:hypothetical protein
MTGDLFIDGIDAWKQWGVFLEDGSIDKLLLPPPAKLHIENKSRSFAGKQVLKKNPQYDERDVTLVFCFASDNKVPFFEGHAFPNFNTRLAAFMYYILEGNVIDDKLYPLSIGVAEIDTVYNVNYVSSVELSSIDNKLGKIAIRFNEPDPTNRQKLSDLNQDKP